MNVDNDDDDDDDDVVQVKCLKVMNVHCNMIAMNCCLYRLT